MKVGVIGGTGMLGHHTAIAIQNAGHELYIIHRKESDLSKISDLKFESIIGDLDDGAGLAQSFHNLDMVINCAAYYPTAPKPLAIEMKTASTQMQNFIDAVEKSKISKALYLGGAIAIPIDESGTASEAKYYDSAPPNKAPYVQVKWLMDKMITEAGKRGVPIVIGIPSMTFGEYDYGPSTGKLIVDIANSDLPAYVRGDRNVIYAGDAGRGLLLACEKGNPGERYLITGQNIQMDELVQLIAANANVDPPTKVLPLTLAKLISFFQETKYKLFKGKLPQLSSTAIAVLSAGQFLDGSKSKNELGFEPEINLDLAIERSVTWFRKMGYIRED